MDTKQGGKFRRQNGKLERVSEPAKQQRYGAHAVHPSKVVTSESTAKAPTAAPAVAPGSAKTKAPVKGNSDDTATNA
jgi:hypothetical protein